MSKDEDTPWEVYNDRPSPPNVNWRKIRAYIIVIGAIVLLYILSDYDISYKISDDPEQSITCDIPKDVLEFKEWLPRCINNCSQYNLKYATYDCTENIVNLIIGTKYTRAFKDLYDGDLIREEREFWFNYIIGSKQPESIRLSNLKSKYGLEITIYGEDYTDLGSFRL
jgi:hypothetical protein